MSQDEKAFGVIPLHLQFALWYLLSTEKTLLDTFDLPPFLIHRKQRDIIIQSGSNPYTMKKKKIHYYYNLHKLVFTALNLQGII